MKEKQRVTNNWVRVNDMNPMKMAIFKKQEKVNLVHHPLAWASNQTLKLLRGVAK